jgi:hypothetical protein
MSLEKITVSKNRHFLVTESGQPFFWLGDTAWELFHRLNPGEAEYYLDVRRSQGFNVIQAVILAETDGLHTPNVNGHLPLNGDDPTRPNEEYFRYVDEIIHLAASMELYIGLLPTWGDKVHTKLWGIGPLIFNTENAYVYGRFLGTRYRNDSNILWILGGDRPADGYEDLWDAMACGIMDGLGYRPFFTYHPIGSKSSSAWLHNAGWLDMNMLQSCHVFLDAPNWEMIRTDYERHPRKPVLDGEPNYEDHPIDPFTRKWQPEYGRFSDYDVRKQAYRSVFAGACGYTYGHQSIWQFWNLEREPINFPVPTWQKAILRPGAAQMIHLKNLMLSRPYFTRVPALDMLPDIQPTPPIGNVEDDCYNPLRASHPVAARDAMGSYGLVYFPLAGQTLRIDLSLLRAGITAQWFDPRDGMCHDAGHHPNEMVTFTSPIAGPDWVLILDADLG